MNCKTCKNPFEPIKGLNGIIKSLDCPDCRFEVERSKRLLNMAQSKSIDVKEGKKSLKSKLNRIKKSDNNRKSLIRKLDDIFSIFIRLRDSDHNGIGKCISCGKPDHWKSCDNGHYIGRQHISTRWDEINCNLQCRHENRFEEGKKAEYRVGLIKKYDLKTVESLELRQHNQSKISTFEIELMIKIYTDKVKKLEAEKLLQGNNF